MIDFTEDWRDYYATVPAVTLDTYEGPEDGQDDEPVDPRDEYDNRDIPSGYEGNWSY